MFYMLEHTASLGGKCNFTVEKKQQKWLMVLILYHSRGEDTWGRAVIRKRERRWATTMSHSRKHSRAPCLSCSFHRMCFFLQTNFHDHGQRACLVVVLRAPGVHFCTELHAARVWPQKTCEPPLQCQLNLRAGPFVFRSHSLCAFLFFVASNEIE